MNRKGIAPLIAVGALVAIVAGVIAFLASPDIRFLISGLVLIGVALIFVAPAALSGDFTREKLLFLLFMIFAGVVVIFIPQLGLVQQTFPGAECTGGTVMSIDDVSLTFSNDLQKDVIRVTYSTVPTGECLKIDVGANEINSRLNAKGEDTFEANTDILGDIVLKDKSKVFNIQENSAKIYRNFKITDMGSQLICEHDPNGGFLSQTDCDGISNFIAAVSEDDGQVNLQDTCLCISHKDEGIDAEFLSSSTLEWETDIIIQGHPTLTLTQDKTSDSIGNIAFVKWVGNLAGNNDLTNPNRDAYKPFSNNQFRLVNRETYTELKNDFDDKSDLISGCVGADCENLGYLNDIRTYINTFNTRTADKLQQWEDDEPLVKDAVITSNELTATLEAEIVYPQFILDIDAESVGIFITVGEAKVTCPSRPDDLVSGQTDTVIFNVENIGDFNGAFEYSLECDKGSQVMQPSPPQPITKNDDLDITATLGLTVDGSIGEQETSSCTFKAKDSNQPSSEYKSCSFSYTATKQTKCIKDTVTCEEGNEERWTCLEDGSSDKEECEFGCGENDDGDLVCFDKGGGNGNDTSIPLPLKCNFLQQEVEIDTVDSGFLGWRKIFNSEKTITTRKCVTNPTFLIIGILLVFALIVTALIVTTSPKNKKKKKKRSRK